ncbi:hypothetical protein WJX84_003936 [Apatococcus fuscideae]|uniref:RRM domain-containing protein n=1 Tax=Apatococcus fuscideae TaxID=2026836 RepID=A0AAW1TGA8_9CHLO
MSSEARSVPNKKRAAEESLAAPTAKRSNSESTDQREAFRSSIRHTYSSFQVLSSEKPQEPGNTQRAYKQLLSAASGDAPSRRLADGHHVNGFMKPLGSPGSLPAGSSISPASLQQALRHTLKGAYQELSPIKGREARAVLGHLLQKLPAVSEPQATGSSPHGEHLPHSQSGAVPLRGSSKNGQPSSQLQEQAPPATVAQRGKQHPSQDPRMLHHPLSHSASPSPAPPAPLDPRSGQAEIKRLAHRSPSIGRKRSRSPGTSRQQHLAPSPSDEPAGRNTLPVFEPGGAVCRASRCLWFGGLHPSVPESELRRECVRFGNVTDIHFPPCRMRDEAHVTFSTIHEAALCYEAMADTAPWGTPPLDVRFCEQLQPQGGLDDGWDEDSRQNIWVANATQSEILDILQGASLPGPQRVLPVAGLKPGFVLNLESPVLVDPTVKALQPRCGSRPGGLRRPSSPPGPPPTQFASEFACRTLWVGQLGPDVSETELLAAFRRCGTVTGHSFIRRSNCAFVDFDSIAAASEAKQALNGARFASCQIRLEFKDEPRGSRGAFREARSPGRLPHKGSMPAPALELQSWGRPPFREGPAAHRGGLTRRESRSAVTSPPPPLPQEHPPAEDGEARDPQLPPLPPEPPSPIPKPPADPPLPPHGTANGAHSSTHASLRTPPPLPKLLPSTGPPRPAACTSHSQHGPAQAALPHQTPTGLVHVPRLPNASLPGPPDAKANGRPQAPSTDTKTEPHDLPKADSGLIAGLPPGFTRPRKSLTPVKPTLPPHAPAPGCSHAASDLEPADWPQQLDVDNRIDVPSVYNSYDRALADQRAGFGPVLHWAELA